MASGCVPAHASYFLAYEHLKLYFDFKNEGLDFLTPICIGCTTTFAHDFFITPADGKCCYSNSHLYVATVVKQRLQLCKNLSAARCFKDIIREEGLRGLYRSYPVTVSMNIPFATSVILFNENLKTYVRPWER